MTPELLTWCLKSTTGEHGSHTDDCCYYYYSTVCFWLASTVLIYSKIIWEKPFHFQALTFYMGH